MDNKNIRSYHNNNRGTHGTALLRYNSVVIENMVEEKGEDKCACTYYLQEQIKLFKEKETFKKIKCKGCGKGFLTDREKDYCFDCEAKYAR